MVAMSGHGTPDLRFELTMPSNTPHIGELAQAKQELELLKATDPFRVVEMAVEIQVQRMCAVEAMNARDAVVQRLSDAYVSLRQKNAVIECLQQEQEAFQKHGLASSSEFGAATGLVETSKLKAEVSMLEEIVKSLREEAKFLKETANNATKSLDPPPRYDEARTKNDIDHAKVGPQSQLIRTETSRIPFRVLRDAPNTLSPISPQISASLTIAETNSKLIIDKSNDLDYKVILRSAPKSNEPEDMINARNMILAALPLPTEIPDDSLKPILIPAPFTLHEFLGNASGSLRNSLSNYRVLQQLTTSWCSNREEHGYFLTPAFKCSTNPRVATAHRWTSVDVVGRMSKPTECFFNKDGMWYYAGVYKAFRLEDLTTKEWEALSSETSQIIIKDTISGRKNTSPQNLYETSQLYAAGALKVACVALQCVGFNKTMYRAILEQATMCALSGKWKGTGSAGGLGTGAVWNASGNSTGDVADGMLSMSLGGRSADGNENIPAEGEGRTKR